MASSDTIHFTGSCFCKTIKLEIHALPRSSYICHCQDCRRFTGTSFAHNLVFPARAVSLIVSGKEQSGVSITTSNESQGDAAESVDSQTGGMIANADLNLLTTYGDSKDGMTKFCATCAGRVLITCGADNTDMADSVIVPIGVIDNSETDARLAPRAEFWCKRRETWMLGMNGTKVFNEM